MKKSTLFSLVLASFFAPCLLLGDLTISTGIIVDGGVRVIGKDGFFVKMDAATTAEPSWTADMSGSFVAWLPYKGALRIGSFSASQTSLSAMGANSIVFNGGVARGARSIVINGGNVATAATNSMIINGGSIYSSNSMVILGGTVYSGNSVAISGGRVGMGTGYGESGSFAQGASYAEGSRTAVFGGGSSGYFSEYAFAAGDAYADSSYSVAFGESTVGRGGNSPYAFGFGDSYLSDYSPYAFIGGTCFIGEEAPYAIALGNDSSVFAANAVAIGQGLLAYSEGGMVVGHYNAPVLPEAGVWSVFEVGIGDVTVGANGQETGERMNAVTVLKNGKTTLKNKYWDAGNPAAAPTVGEGQTDTTGAGVALDVEGHTVLRGNVTMTSAQGDILMGVFGGETESTGAGSGE